ncbi:MAG: UDP-4-amino-4,6-dideoxy-N-acetyl-beta-L-altrosamine transaminase [Nevskiaceae bacterium]|nr:MAG: UDP-4-amino-4,6-dideoxy-N-acetyl-beta-L-altrosamine transaminase [Nevskiaceae bacterium]
MIPYGRQCIDDSDVAAVEAVLRSDFLTQGPAVGRFEEEVSTYCGGAHAVAMNSATSALHVACLALGLGPGDLLWTVPNTFVASANCARYCGADVDFVDIDPATHNMNMEALAAKLDQARRSGRLPKVVVPVHFAGQPCDLGAIEELSKQYGFRVIEDASHAIGAEYRGEKVGSGRYSDVTIFSFHPVKIITTGEGGMALTNDAKLAGRMRLLRTHGITRAADEMVGTYLGEWYYEQIDLGYNYRMTDIQAALGCSQLRRLGGFIQRRRQIVERYGALLADLPIQLPIEAKNGKGGWHLYVICLDRKAPVGRETLYREMRANGIGVNVHYFPVHLQPYYRKLGFSEGNFPVAESYGQRCLSLPIHPGLTDEQQDKIIGTLRRVLSQNG